MTPLVSIAIPAYKKKFLAEAIQSVLNQSIQDFELIIVNDKSPEDIDCVVENFNDNPVTVRVVVNTKVSSLRNLITGELLKPAELPAPQGFFGRNRFFGYAEGATAFDITLAAHSYAGLGYGK